MHLLVAPDAYAVVEGDSVLRACRHTGRLVACDASAICELGAPRCRGDVHCVLGRLCVGAATHLLVVTQRATAGVHPLQPAPMWRITRVVALPLRPDVEPDWDDETYRLPKCSLHDSSTSSESPRSVFSPSVNKGIDLLQKKQQKMFRSTLTTLKQAVVGSAGSAPLSSVSTEAFVPREVEVEKRLLEEVLRIFNDAGSFFYSRDIDLTLRCQRLIELEKGKKPSGGGTEEEPGYIDWRLSDRRFFWNRVLLEDLIDQSMQNEGFFGFIARWIVPVIQGFVQVAQFDVPLDPTHAAALVRRSPSTPTHPRPTPPPSALVATLALLSRRSVYRAGTRYIKRGIDGEGNVANYVETEQILGLAGHVLAFVQVRGSVPVFWSQAGYRYKPAPRIDRTVQESAEAFGKHFDDELTRYDNRVVCINLVEQAGREGVLAEAFLHQVLTLDEPRLAYLAFDFHEHCRALRFDNVVLLLDALRQGAVPILRTMRFTWLDRRREVACRQEGVLRVNCVDCLDRTNVVQAAVGAAMLESQLQKFGILVPEAPLPEDCALLLKLMWANNGDCISRQYAGTAALKGDYTRTGQRNLAGLMKDGYHSANRYYLSHVKDRKRQAAIDILLGRLPVFDIEADEQAESREDEWMRDKDEQLRLLVEDCKRLILPEDAVLLGGWALIDADPATSDPLQEDMDVVVLLTASAYYVAYYDEAADKFEDFTSILLNHITHVETGPMPASSQTLLLGSSQSKASKPCLRVRFRRPTDTTECFHVWRSASTRLFNNMAIAVRGAEDAAEYLLSIRDQFESALATIAPTAGVPAKCSTLERMDRKRGGTPGRRPTAWRTMDPLGVFAPSRPGALGSKLAGALNPKKLSRFTRSRAGADQAIASSTSSATSSQPEQIEETTAAEVDDVLTVVEADAATELLMDAMDGPLNLSIGPGIQPGELLSPFPGLAPTPLSVQPSVPTTTTGLSKQHSHSTADLPEQTDNEAAMDSNTEPQANTHQPALDRLPSFMKESQSESCLQHLVSPGDAQPQSSVMQRLTDANAAGRFFSGAASQLSRFATSTGSRVAQSAAKGLRLPLQGVSAPYACVDKLATLDDDMRARVEACQSQITLL